MEEDGEQLGQRVRVGQRLRVVGRVPPNLAERPRRRALDVVLGLGDDRVDERRDPLRDDDGEGAADRVKRMRVSELRKELADANLDTDGARGELEERLRGLSA